MARPPKKYDVAVKHTVFQEIERGLLKHGEVKIFDFGVVKLKKMKSLVRYIPGKRKVGRIKSHIRVKFTADKALKTKIQAYKP